MLPFREHGPHDATPVLILLHFFGGSHREWDGVVHELQTRYRIIAADMAGFGEAAALDGFSVEAMAARVRQLVDYVAPAPVVLVGHSMSGKAAMVLGGDPPANLKGLVLVAPSPLGGEPMTDKQRSDMRMANTTRERAEDFTRNGFVHPPSGQTFELAVEDVLRSSDDAFHAWADSGTREDWSGRVTALRIPTLLIVGDRDKAIAPDLQRKETLPLVDASGGRMHLLSDCAHMVPYEQPRQLATLLDQFTQEIA